MLQCCQCYGWTVEVCCKLLALQKRNGVPLFWYVTLVLSASPSQPISVHDLNPQPLDRQSSMLLLSYYRPLVADGLRRKWPTIALAFNNILASPETSLYSSTVVMTSWTECSKHGLQRTFWIKFVIATLIFVALPMTVPWLFSARTIRPLDYSAPRWTIRLLAYFASGQFGLWYIVSEHRRQCFANIRKLKY